MAKSLFPTGSKPGMKSGHLAYTARMLVALAMTATCVQAAAQYVWTNENGVRQYSDRPPPASVPDSRIIRGKNMPAAMLSSAPSSSPSANAALAPSAVVRPAAPSLAERNADFNKRRKEQAENEKK